MPSAEMPPKASSCGGTSAPERASAEKKSGMSACSPVFGAAVWKKVLSLWLSFLYSSQLLAWLVTIFLSSGVQSFSGFRRISFRFVEDLFGAALSPPKSPSNSMDGERARTAVACGTRGSRSAWLLASSRAASRARIGE